MGGGGVICNLIPYLELEAWGRISGNNPTSWELATLHAMDLCYVNAKSEKDNKVSSNKNQAIGDYCHGDEVEKCRLTFGDQMEKVCSTCPN